MVRKKQEQRLDPTDAKNEKKNSEKVRKEESLE